MLKEFAAIMTMQITVESIVDQYTIFTIDFERDNIYEENNFICINYNSFS